MTIKTSFLTLAISLSIVGCTSQKTNQTATPVTPSAAVAASAESPSAAQTTRTVKSKNGNFDGEIVGTPDPKSRFAKLQVGMLMREVTDLIGAPDNLLRHETGKRWIPFYFGSDAQRLQVLYKNEGCLTFTAGNVFGGGSNELIRITADPKGGCFNE